MKLWQEPARAQIPLPPPPPPVGLPQVPAPSLPPGPVADHGVVPGAGFIDELVSILNETRSPDAFLVTLSILQEIKPDAQTVVPAIIRNAERLRLFKRTDPDQPTEQQKMIVECIAALLKKDNVPTANIDEILSKAESLRAAGALLSSAPVYGAESQVTTPVEERPAGDPLLGTPGVETKPATDTVIPGKVKSRPGVVK